MSDKKTFIDSGEPIMFPNGDVMVEVDNDKGKSLSINPSDVIVIPLRDMVVMPMVPVPIQIGRESTYLAAKAAVDNRKGVFLVCQENAEAESPKLKSDFKKNGVLAHIVKMIDLPDGTHTIFTMPIVPAQLDKILSDEPYLRAKTTDRPKWWNVKRSDQSTWKAMTEMISENYQTLLSYVPEEEAKQLRFSLEQFSDEATRINFMIINSPLTTDEKQKLLDDNNAVNRASRLLAYFDVHTQQMQIRAEIVEKSHEEMTQQQKEDFLHRQMRAIQNELGDCENDDVEGLRKRADVKNWPKEALEHFNKEIKKLQRLNVQSPDYSVQYSYLDTFLNLPWDDYSEDTINLKKISQELNKDHYGLKDVKERILEQMAVIKLRGDMKAPILCLYGPPGVGKTSLGRSIANAIGREYVRVSLGGLHDEAEIRGHRRTYIGAMPGRIIKALEKCGKGNPVFVLDEIDKIGADHKGDPATALLELLDPEQNNAFHDNYVDFDYDLSNVMFIATANTLSTLSAPLLDRMELINISGYTTDEKVEIARRHLIPKALEANGLADTFLTFNKNAIAYIIDHYTRENGVRQLEKMIVKILRKIAYLKASGEVVPFKVNKDSVPRYLGKEQVMPDLYENNDTPGVVTGLAWTSVGGDILFIESSLSECKGGKLTLTGNLGNVMKESAEIALQYVKANADRFGIDTSLFESRNVHIHVPEGAIPKDGPSAGITMVTSLVSTFTNRKVREKTAMTGEITLRGKVLPVGGIKEKMLAAKRAGITDIVLSRQNHKDIKEIEDEYLKGLKFHYVDRIEEVIDFAIPAE